MFLFLENIKDFVRGDTDHHDDDDHHGDDHSKEDDDHHDDHDDDHDDDDRLIKRKVDLHFMKLIRKERFFLFSLENSLCDTNI